MHDLESRARKGERGAGGALRGAGDLLGILQESTESWFRGTVDDAVAEAIARRNEARADKDFRVADRIRDELRDEGIELMDGPGGTTWRRI